MKPNQYRGISLFSGAGGMDVGFKRAGIEVVWANELDKNACDTYKANHSSALSRGDIAEHLSTLKQLRNIDVLFGGPPCQGFSVAGKMNPRDERSTLLWKFLDCVKLAQPKGFVCENVKALGTLNKWKHIRGDFIKMAKDMGYGCTFHILDAAEFGVPQKRERVFFFGVKGQHLNLDEVMVRFNKYKRIPKSIRQTIKILGPAGSANNSRTCNAKITIAKKPILRKSPYAGMLFNGLGRPLNLEGYSSTLPASMGGNKTPIIDEALLYGTTKQDWVKEYHSKLLRGAYPLPFGLAPSHLRRLTIDEAKLLQTFPQNYRFIGGMSSIFNQIGNAVPCLLAETVANVILEIIECAALTKQETISLTQNQLPLAL